MHTNLPHIDLPQQYQFITFRTKESIDSYLKKIKENQNLSTKQKEYQINRYLDNSNHGSYFYDEILSISHKYLQNIDPNIYKVIAYTIMPNHIHILLQHIKGRLASVINHHLKRSGSFWQKDYFDKGIRDQRDFNIVYEYIQQNAIKADLKDCKNRFYSIYE